MSSVVTDPPDTQSTPTIPNRAGEMPQFAIVAVIGVALIGVAVQILIAAWGWWSINHAMHPLPLVRWTLVFLTITPLVLGVETARLLRIRGTAPQRRYMVAAITVIIASMVAVVAANWVIVYSG